MHRPATQWSRYRVAKRPTIKDGYPQRIPIWEAVQRLDSANRTELLSELRRIHYVRPNGAAVDEAYCRIELADMTKRGFLVREDESGVPSCNVQRQPTAFRRSVSPVAVAPSRVQIAAGGTTVAPIISTALDALPAALLERSGSLFYSGCTAFASPSRVYLLGLNPGGDPVSQREETVGVDLRQFREQPASWSAYRDESWAGSVPGTRGMQPRVLHLLQRLGLHPHDVPASNVVFVRSARETALAGEKDRLLEECWPVHEAVIRALGIDTILAFGGTAGRWVRGMLGADIPFGQFVEANARRWTSEAHLNSGGMCVVTLTHPSIADWRRAETDPTPLVLRALAR